MIITDEPGAPVKSSAALAEKIWAAHVVERGGADSGILFIDRHLTREVTSPQAFGGLRPRERKVRQPDPFGRGP